MAKIIDGVVIKCCTDCPYIHEPGADHPFFCSESENGWKDIRDEKIIPGWCKFPDDRRKENK